jgi:hypothetical protein
VKGLCPKQNAQSGYVPAEIQAGNFANTSQKQNQLIQTVIYVSLYVGINVSEQYTSPSTGLMYG